MRIRQLDLTRYGHFTDRTIDFGASEPGRPDFHVIHGANEAGKSTLFSAWLDFLYGMPTQSPYNFRHDYKVMRVGAMLETASGARRFWRIKKPSASLLDGNDQPVGDMSLAGDLSGLDREAYRAMFSLDETSLEQGGEAILASKGDVGRMLFSASAGLSSLSQRLDGIRAEIDEFYKPRSQKSILADLKRQLDELKAERDRLDFAASDHARLVSERDATERLHLETSKRRADVRLRMDHAGRLLAALPLHARSQALQQEMDGLVVSSPPPSGWAEAIPDIRRRAVELATALARVERDMGELQAALSNGPQRNPILERADAVDALAGPAGRAFSEEEDLPNRLAERNQADQVIADILRRLGREVEEDPRALALPIRVTGTLKALISDHSGLVQRLETARREVRKAEESWRDLQATQGGDLGPSAKADPRAEALLGERLASARAADPMGRLARANRAVDVARGVLDRRLPSLHPWTGDTQALAKLRAPVPSLLADIGARLEAASMARARATSERDGLKVEHAGLLAEREAVAAIPGLIADGAARDSRQQREAAWEAHRKTLDAATADSFRQKLEADDRLVDMRLTQIGEVARLRTLDQTLARVGARLAEAQLIQAAAVEAEASVRAELGAMISRVSPVLPDDMNFRAFEAWCAALEAALTALGALEEAEAEQTSADQALAVARQRLVEAMGGVGLECSDADGFDSLLTRAQGFIDDSARRAAIQARFTAGETDLRRRQGELIEAEQADRAWHEAWTSALAGTWLAERAPSPAEMAEVLDTLQTLESAISARASIDDRIAKMERDISGFYDDLTALGEALGLDANESKRVLYGRLTKALALARQEESKRQSTGVQLDRLAAERRDLQEEKGALEGRIRTMTGHFGVETLDGVEQTLAVIARRRLLEVELTQLTQELAQSLRTTSAEETSTLLAGADRLSLEQEIELLRPQCDALDEETSRAFATLARAQERLAAMDGDDAVARLQEARRTVMLEIEDGARRAIELRLGALATDQALRLYRDRHRSSMMSRASTAFAQLTRGNYSGLSTHREGQRETLVANGVDGSSKEAGDLSKGTQFQLYLALRVAGYLETAAMRPPVPFIADDIMESFDEDRAAEALAQLAIMAGSGQVIYLTHHQHICTIAQSVCPSVTLHHL